MEANKLITLVATTLLSSPLLAGPIVTPVGFLHRLTSLQMPHSIPEPAPLQLLIVSCLGAMAVVTTQARQQMPATIEDALTVGSSLTNKAGEWPSDWSDQAQLLVEHQISWQVKLDLRYQFLMH